MHGSFNLFQWKPKGSQPRKEEIIMISRIRNGKLWSFKKWRTWQYFKWITRHLFSGIWRIMQIWGSVTHLGHNTLFHRNNSWSIIVKYYFFYFVVRSSHHQEVDFPPPNNFEIIHTIKIPWIIYLGFLLCRLIFDPIIHDPCIELLMSFNNTLTTTTHFLENMTK